VLWAIRVLGLAGCILQLPFCFYCGTHIFPRSYLAPLEPSVLSHSFCPSRNIAVPCTPCTHSSAFVLLETPLTLPCLVLLSNFAIPALALDEYESIIPATLPPSYRGDAISYTHKVVVGTQRLSGAVQLVRLSFRVLPVNALMERVRRDGSMSAYGEQASPLREVIVTPPPQEIGEEEMEEEAQRGAKTSAAAAAAFGETSVAPAAPPATAEDADAIDALLTFPGESGSATPQEAPGTPRETPATPREAPATPSPATAHAADKERDNTPPGDDASGCCITEKPCSMAEYVWLLTRIQ